MPPEARQNGSEVLELNPVLWGYKPVTYVTMSDSRIPKARPVKRVPSLAVATFPINHWVIVSAFFSALNLTIFIRGKPDLSNVLIVFKSQRDQWFRR